MDGMKIGADAVKAGKGETIQTPKVKVPNVDAASLAGINETIKLGNQPNPLKAKANKISEEKKAEEAFKKENEQALADLEEKDKQTLNPVKEEVPSETVDEWKSVQSRIRDGKASDEDIKVAYEKYKQGMYTPGPETKKEFNRLEGNSIMDALSNDPEGSKIMENAFGDSGNAGTAKDNLDKTMNDEYGSKDPEKATQNALQTNGWDRLAKILTGVSMTLFVLSEGEVPPMNFMYLTDTKEKEAAARDLAKKEKEYILSQKNLEEEEKIKRESAQKDIIERSNMYKDYVDEYKKQHPGATDAQAEAYADKMLTQAGKTQYLSTGAETSKQYDFDRELKKLDADTKAQISVQAASAHDLLDQIKVQAAEGRDTARLQAKLQQDIAAKLQDLQDKSPAQTYQYLSNLGVSPSRLNEYMRSVGGNVKLGKEYAYEVASDLIGTAGKAFTLGK